MLPIHLYTLEVWSSKESRHKTVMRLYSLYGQHFQTPPILQPRTQTFPRFSDMTAFMCRSCVDGEWRTPEAYHVQTRLPDGRPSLLVDPGSVGNLCGDVWAKSVAEAAHRHGHNPSYNKRNRPLRVQGVGNGAQSCNYDCTLPIALKQKDKSVAMGKLLIPTVSGSDLPGLLGLAALRKNRGILDFNTMDLHFCGPGDYDLLKALPPGTHTFQLELAPSGHMVLPCCEFPSSSDTASPEDYTLTLMICPWCHHRPDSRPIDGARTEGTLLKSTTRGQV